MHKAFIVNGMSFGDESKASTVDYLVRKFNAKTVVRFSGGSQCGHNVVTPEGLYHEFAQFSSGSFAGARTFLSKHMLVAPMSLMEECFKLQNLTFYPEIFIDKNATVTTPYHSLFNQIKEKRRGDKRYGSCGKGIGATRKDQLKGLKLIINDLFDLDLAREKLIEIRDSKKEFIFDSDAEKEKFFSEEFLQFTLDGYYLFAESAKRNICDSNKLDEFLYEGNVVFEGAQGLLLDEKWGFAPHNSWTNTTFDNALELLKDYKGEITKLGLTRSYVTRHGPGPFPTEDESVTYPEPHNGFNDWQRNFRKGYLDLPALDYAIRASGGIDALTISHLDFLPEKVKVCVGYSGGTDEYEGALKNERWKRIQTEFLFKKKPIYVEVSKNNLIEFIEDNLNVKIKLQSFGNTWKDKTDCL